MIYYTQLSLYMYYASVQLKFKYKYKICDDGTPDGMSCTLI